MEWDIENGAFLVVDCNGGIHLVELEADGWTIRGFELHVGIEESDTLIVDVFREVASSGAASTNMAVQCVWNFVSNHRFVLSETAKSIKRKLAFLASFLLSILDYPLSE
ncbi:MAG: hypothetical protein KBS81_00470 [Spirochaetales bacterium]|nr:hypothetical protein [Candidatus Physcosoma equi]